MSDYMNDTPNIVELPVLPLKGLVVFPDMILHFDVGRKRSKAAVEAAMLNNQEIFVTTQKLTSVNRPKLDDVYKVGVICNITQIVNQQEDIIRVTIQGKYRGILKEITSDTNCLFAKVEEVPRSEITDSEKGDALVRAAKNVFEQYISITPSFSTDYLYKLSLCKDASEIADYIASNIITDYTNKQTILNIFDIEARLEALIELLLEEINVIEIENDIVEKARQNIEKNQRDYFLREQLAVIQEELGEQDNPESESEEYKKKILDLHLDEEIEKTLLKECAKLQKMGYSNQEATVIRTYLDTCLDLPWNKFTTDKLEIHKVRKSLDKEHYGLNKVKDRIIEQLAVKILNRKNNSQIICLVGPPGVGKTSIAQSIAKAIGKNSARIALGGIHDEAEIRGHRKTYIGSMPGRIINAMRSAKSMNPLIILDEVDKLGQDYKGDPTSALLEVLDSEQNSTFVDHYLEIPFDLSNVMFITTANDLSLIPTPLRDRMDIIELPSYTREEKLNIAKKHLIKKQLELNGLDKTQFKISSKGIYSLIDYYTREAGVRSLERTIASLMRKSAVKILMEEVDSVSITDKNVQEFLGAYKFTDDTKSKRNEVGVVNGLAWTSVGGTLLPIEVALMPGKGNIQLTGSLGEVMQESAKIAITCIRTMSEKYIINNDFYRKNDIHLHAPEGAVPKDGPSAGVTMATAIFSALTNMPVRSDVAMTGEITLRGKILPIGGLREKSMAAYRNGMKTVIIPYDNIKDLEEVDDVVKEKVEFKPVKHITEVLEIAICNYNKSFAKSTGTSVKDGLVNAIRQ
ncbi:MAG: endopeptidase La [Ruminococcus sp.]|nr:endopeptidase La [Ruminococcus sp.]